MFHVKQLIKGGIKVYTQEQVNQLITDVVANLGDQGKVTELLQDFRTDYTGTLADVSTLTTEKESLLKNNESLRNVNNKMMAQLGDISFLGNKDKIEKKKEEESKETETQEKEKEKDYDDLFKEDGELK